jgi:hypothetical protein
MDNQFLIIITILIICLLLFKNKITEHMTDGLNESILNKMSELALDVTNVKNSMNTYVNTQKLKHRGDSSAPYIEFYHNTDKGKRSGYIGLGSAGDTSMRMNAQTGNLLLYGKGTNNLSVTGTGVVMNGYTFTKSDMKLFRSLLDNLKTGYIQLGSWKIKAVGDKIYFNYGNADKNSFLVGYSKTELHGYKGSTYTGASYVNGRWLG